jgi:hypothetical protein
LSLQPDAYTLTVRHEGFREKTQRFTLAVGQRTELDMAMDLGSVNEQVTVAAEAARVETASSELSNKYQSANTASGRNCEPVHISISAMGPPSDLGVTPHITRGRRLMSTNCGFQPLANS